MRNIFQQLMVIFLIGGLSACGAGEESSTGKPVAQVQRIEITSTEKKLRYQGDNFIVSARAYDSKDQSTDVRLSWSSSNPACISINPATGEVTALTIGSSIIIAGSKGVFSNELKVTYSLQKTKQAKPTKLNIDKRVVKIYKLELNLHHLFFGEEKLSHSEEYLFDGFMVNSTWLSGFSAKIISDKPVSLKVLRPNRDKYTKRDQLKMDENKLHGYAPDFIDDLYVSEISSEDSELIDPLNIGLTSPTYNSLFDINTTVENKSSIAVKPIFEYDEISREFLDLGLSGSVTVFFK